MTCLATQHGGGGWSYVHRCWLSFLLMNCRCWKLQAFGFDRAPRCDLDIGDNRRRDLKEEEQVINQRLKKKVFRSDKMPPLPGINPLTTGHLVLVYLRSKQIKGSNELYLSGQNTTCKSPLSSYKTTLKQQLNGEKWDVELRHLSGFGWAMLFSCPVLGRSCQYSPYRHNMRQRLMGVANIWWVNAWRMARKH